MVMIVGYMIYSFMVMIFGRMMVCLFGRLTTD